jgi:hypothetical protein
MTVLEAGKIDRLCCTVSVSSWRDLKHVDRSRFLAYQDYWLTAKTLLSFPHFLWYGAYWSARKHYRGELFYRMAHWMEEWAEKIKILLVAREHTKTQMAIAWMAWKLARDVNTRILIRAYNTPKAQQIGRGLRELLDSTDFRSRYTWVTPKLKRDTRQKEMWGNEGLILERPDVGVRVPSVEMCGLEKDPTGGHFNVGLCDDYAIKENETSETLQKDLFAKFEEDDNLMLAGGQRLICGTIWAKDGFLDSAKNGEKIFSDIDYDLFLQPGEVEAFPVPLAGREVVMDPDRMTFRVADAPISESLKYHQAKLTFENGDEGDTDVVIREVLWNDEHSFRVNRPIDDLYTGGPLGFTIGNTKPAAPSRFTLDCVDHMQPEELRDTFPDRASLYQKRKTQGPYTYGCNVMLNPLAKESLMFDSEKIRWISKKDFDALVAKESGVWYRKCDLATSKDTGSYTAMATGFVCFKGVFLRRIFWGLPKTDEILLELFRGQLWLQDRYQANLRHTQLETQMLEKNIGEQLETAQQNPYEYFRLIQRHKAYAEAHFANLRSMRIHISMKSRGMASKMDRIRDNLDPVLEQERLYIVEGIEHADRAEKEITEATADNDKGVDLLETIADLCAEVKPPKETRKELPTVGQFDEYQRRAIREHQLASLGSMGYV